MMMMQASTWATATAMFAHTERASPAGIYFSTLITSPSDTNNYIS